jgi:phenylalanyl-tRNA synthetase beta chain
MKVLHSWLQEYLKFNLRPEDLGDRLGMLGLEVASIEHLGEKYNGFVVGKVLETRKHPNADHLTVCAVDVGREQLQIVCGAPNVAAGQRVPVGTMGAKVPRNQHDPEGKPFELSRVSLRGVESFGMICSEYELDLGKDADGIMVLDPAARVGQTLSVYLGLDDVAYDIEITPNRPDWLSHFGIAREIGLLVGRHPHLPRVRLKEGKESIRRHLRVTVEDRVHCVRFAARMLRGVTVTPSPEWLQRALRNSGLRPRNTVVDVTNYVMLECGHPLHAFDYRLLAGGSIVVRRAGMAKRFTTLDGTEHELPPDAVMVCDADKEVSVAGVMGGANSEISDRTVDVVLESACWSPASIRRTAKALGISSDASQRFERGADPNGVPHALGRAAQLVHELAGGTLLRGTIDVYPRVIRPRAVTLRTARVNQVLGTSLKEAEVIKLLRALDIVPAGKRGGAVVFHVPTFRVDIEREIDLIEETARAYGYNKIEAKTTALVESAQSFPLVHSTEHVRECLIGLGYQECLTDSMQDEFRALLGTGTPAKVLNPLGVEMACLRASLVPGLLDSVARNQNFGNTDLRFFEMGHVFSVDPEKRPQRVENYVEEERVCLLLTGLARPRHYDEPSRMCDVFDLKGDILSLVDRSLLDKCRLISYSTSDGLTDDTLALEIQGTYVGFLGRMKPGLLEKFGIEQDVFVGELLVGSLVRWHDRQYQRLPKFPKVKRDLAFLVDRQTPVGILEDSIRAASGELLQRVELFDVFEGGNVPAGKKSVAFSLELLSRERTLADADIEACIKGVVAHLESSHGAILRSAKGTG